MTPEGPSLVSLPLAYNELHFPTRPILFQQVALCVTGVPGMGRSSALQELIPHLRSINPSWLYIDTEHFFSPRTRARMSELTGREMDTPAFLEVSIGSRDDRIEFGRLKVKEGHCLLFTETSRALADPKSPSHFRNLLEMFAPVPLRIINLKLDCGSRDDTIAELIARLTKRSAGDPEGYGKMDQRKLRDPDFYPAYFDRHAENLAAFPHEEVSYLKTHSPQQLAAMLLKTIFAVENHDSLLRKD